MHVAVSGPSRARRRVVVRGVVQGVGFRPFVYALARSLGLSGGVWNTGDGVVAEVEGDPRSVATFVARLAPDAPPLAVVVDVTDTAVPVQGGTTFTIAPSRGGPGRTFVSPDVSVCDDCLAELRDPADRRYRHPFITCTSCGPRFTVTTGLPYDREHTTMTGFPLCDACAREYGDPADRRFHAQTVCCRECGPRLHLAVPGRPTLVGETALAEARGLLRDGAVVAVKGIGGYHLACDATAPDAVETLRKRKRRGDKPFALMVADAAAADRLVHLDDAERALLTARSRPVVLARRRTRGPAADAVAPGNDDLGVMLAYTPLHHLLLGLPGDDHLPVLVMTSGNLTGEPIVTDDTDARTRLGGLADAWLYGDRPIHVPCDDTVTRAVDGAEAPVRRSRGQAPLPIALPFDSPPLLGVGGDLKNTLCLAEGRLAWMSAHVGDMDDLATLAAFTTAEAHLELLTGVAPTALATDRHPAYRSRRWALDHADGRPVEGVQHHHAHVASTMVEHGLGPEATVLGVVFDGTGYGDDGAVWGGELLVAGYGDFDRAAHLAYVALPGGDAGVRNPCRMALSHLRSAGVAWDDALPCVRACADDELALLDRQLDTGLGCAPTSSMGRLFDAVASIAGICHRAGYDAQAAMELEARARSAGSVDGYRFAVQGELLDAAPVVAAAADDVRTGVPPAVVAARFQRAVVDLVVAVTERLRDETGLRVATLSGGVFLNAYLTSACAAALTARRFEVLRHHAVPASDAGIALGQVAVLAHRHNRDAGRARHDVRREGSSHVPSGSGPGPGHQRA
ncbi:carbamoyltransferase HypF [Nocardioides iriomotensis]|uniref:Carbamoyltransferase n=1 Tax=Nocardioides iriomotensis TaxID=715784 RepID=A0A4Q5J0Z8_9ACTN|nr:carbamoyltransferase HypF [Nocardioides iriomotensis]RYU12074.1 carbamoyltransferase HypF [Nocardioides iriomotensis]